MRGILASLLLCLIALPALAAAPASAAAAAKPPALLYLATWPHQIVVVDADKEKIVDRINVDTDVVRQLVLSPDHKKLYAASFAHDGIATVDLTTRKVIDSFDLDNDNHKVRLSGITIDPTGKLLYSIETVVTKQLDHYDISDPKFVVIDLSAKAIVRSADLPKGEDNPGFFRGTMKVSPDGKYLYLFRDTIEVFDTSNFKLIKKIELEQPPVPDMQNLSLNLVDDPNESPDKVIGLFRSTDPFVHRETFGLAEINLSNLSFDVSPVGPVTTTSVAPLMLTPDRKTGYTAVINGVNGNRITEFWVFDMASKKIVAKKEFAGRTRFNFGVTADGKKLLIYNAGYQIEVYDAKTLEMTTDINLGGDTTSNLVVVPQGE